MSVNEPSTKDMLEHAWRYFALHAAQRVSLFNFFLLVSGSLSAGIAACLQRSGLFTALGIGLGVMLMLVAFVFWKLDQRTAFLVRHGETAIIEIEQRLPLKSAQVLSREPVRTAAQESAPPLVRMWSYGKVFRFVFWLMGIVGFIAALLFLGRYLGWTIN